MPASCKENRKAYFIFQNFIQICSQFLPWNSLTKVSQMLNICWIIILESCTLFHVTPFRKVIGSVKKNTLRYFQLCFLQFCHFVWCKSKNYIYDFYKISIKWSAEKSKHKMFWHIFENYQCSSTFYKFFDIESKTSKAFKIPLKNQKCPENC